MDAKKKKWLEDAIETYRVALDETEDAIVMIRGMLESESVDRSCRAMSQAMNALNTQKRRYEELIEYWKDELKKLGGQDESSKEKVR